MTSQGVAGSYFVLFGRSFFLFFSFLFLLLFSFIYLFLLLLLLFCFVFFHCIDFLSVSFSLRKNEKENTRVPGNNIVNANATQRFCCSPLKQKHFMMTLADLIELIIAISRLKSETSRLVWNEWIAVRPRRFDEALLVNLNAKLLNQLAVTALHWNVSNNFRLVRCCRPLKSHGWKIRNRIRREM